MEYGLYRTLQNFNKLQNVGAEADFRRVVADSECEISNKLQNLLTLYTSMCMFLCTSMCHMDCIVTVSQLFVVTDSQNWLAATKATDRWNLLFCII